MAIAVVVVPTTIITTTTTATAIYLTNTTTTNNNNNGTRTTSCLTLPQETLESILDYLRDDHASLLACSLVASRMLPRCRFHIFADLTLDCAGIESFMKLLEAPGCSLGMSVEKMTLTGIRMAGSMEMMGSTRPKRGGVRGNTTGAPLNELDRLYRMLASVKTLRLVHISLSDIPPSFFQTLHQLKSVKEVEIVDVACHSPGQIFGLIGSLPMIEKLSIARLSSASILMPVFKPTTGLPNQNGGLPANGAGDTTIMMPRLNTPTAKVVIPLLDLRKYAFQHYDPTMSVMVLEWMIQQCPPVEIEEMRFSVDAGNAVMALLKRYFAINGESVKGLCVSLPPSSSALRRIASVDISPCSNLERLEIEGLRTSHPSVIQIHLEGYLKSFLTQLLLPLGTGQNRSKEAVNVSKMVPLKTLCIAVEIDTRISAHSTNSGSASDAVVSFGWCGLPAVVEALLEKAGLSTTRVELRVEMGARGDHTGIENALRSGVWKTMNDMGRLDVVCETN